MHAVARNLTAGFSAEVPQDFGETFQYGKVFYSQWNECLVTVEDYVPDVFSKYINNDDIIEPDNMESDEIFQKAQCLAHFTYMYSEKRLIVLVHTLWRQTTHHTRYIFVLATFPL